MTEIVVTLKFKRYLPKAEPKKTRVYVNKNEYREKPKI